MKRDFWQSHECEGYRAKVTVEWSAPDGIDVEELPAWRMAKAEEIAGAVLGAVAFKTYEIVQAMRGRTVRNYDEPAKAIDDVPSCGSENGPRNSRWPFA